MVTVAPLMASISLGSFFPVFVQTTVPPGIPANWEVKLSSAQVAPRPAVSPCEMMEIPFRVVRLQEFQAQHTRLSDA